MSKLKYLIIIPSLYWGATYDFYEIPLGIGYISAALHNLGYEGEIVNINEYNDDYIARELLRKIHKVDVVLCGGLSSQFRSIREILTAVKRHNPTVTTITGGGMISAQPELTTLIGADIGVIGEGELALREVFEMLERGQDIPRGSCIQAKTYVDMNTLSLPDYEGLIRPLWIERQRPTSTNYIYPFDTPRVLPLVTTRGCPFNCTFCFSPLGRTYRERSIPKVLEDVEQMCSKFNINILNIYDEVMSLKKDRLFEFCKGIKKFNIKWLTEFRLSVVDRELLRILKDAGCYMVNVGVENVNDEILKSMNKGTTLQQIENMLQLCYEEKMAVCGNVLMFDAAETPKTVEFSLDWLRKNKKYTINCVPVQPYPGSPLYKEYVKRGLIKEIEFVEQGCPFPIKPPAMTEQEFKDATAKYYDYRRNGEYLLGKVISFKEIGCEARGPLYEVTVECPHCNSVITYKNILYATWMATSFPDMERVRIGCRNCNAKFDITKRDPTTELVQTRT